MSYIDYNKIAKAIVKKQIENMTATTEKGKAPDLYWSLEAAIADALKYVANRKEKEVKLNMYQLIKEFDENDGDTNQ